MLGITNRASRLFLDILNGETGLSAGALDADAEPMSAVRAGHVSADIAERSPIRYPVAYLYVEKLANSMAEKFRTFSGTARLTLEVRVSQERPDNIEPELLSRVENVLHVLNTHRGDWGYGVFFGGRYEVTFTPVKAGGKGFMQTARIGIDVNVSID
ncbi:MAG: hypothetical protein JNL98_11155 [Bryobacterales bacterium]|nr:hypothetical protein [Bryobacterales bacterium]